MVLLKSQGKLWVKVDSTISGGSGAKVTGPLTTTGDVVANSIKLDNHTHGGVQAGSFFNI